jgi:demethylmenaquinone methyltransferase/2-methoxy-6-polyprenyl-1,4-benzoquinol methylase
VSSSPSRSSPAAAVAPHPPIKGYYELESEKPAVVRGLFDEAAADYDRIERVMALGSGARYRGRALTLAGLRPGMRVLDVACGTGLVARQAVEIVGDPSLVIGIDPSPGMLAEARRALPPGVRLARGVAEQLPLADASVDFLVMGYALRHVSDLGATFREFARVLRRGGRACVLEITRPVGRIRFAALRAYMHGVVPAIARMTTRGPGSRRLWSYYWDSIERCVPPENILAAMTDAGFGGVERGVQLGIFSAYTGRRNGSADH